MAKRGGLGKGLDALIPGGDKPTSGSAIFVNTASVIPNPHQPRQSIKNEDILELAASIREHGILQPLIVTQEPETDRYVLIAGERRLRAAQQAGIEMVPVILRQATDQEMLELALIENVQRSDLTPLETAEAYRQLSELFHLSHEEIAERVGKSRVAVTNTLRLLNLAESVQKALAQGSISEGHARALLGLSNHQAQAAALHTVLEHELTVRQTEKLVQRLSGERTARKAAREPVSPEIQELEDRLLHHLGTKVSLHHGKRGGTLTFYYYSDEELDALIGRILSE